MDQLGLPAIICINLNFRYTMIKTVMRGCFKIKTHDSESRGQEETAIIRETKNTRPLSELFTRKFVQKITNALVKLP